MLLGVPYHVSLIYTAGAEDWSLASSETSILLGIFGSASHVFRMPVFFVVAGYFAAVTLSRKAPIQWLQQRVLRLGVPLLASTALIVPMLMFLYRLAAATAKAGPTATISELVPSVWLATRTALITPDGNWTAHLWFLQALLIYSGALALIWNIGNRPSVAKLKNLLEKTWSTKPLWTLAGLILTIAFFVVAAKAAVTLDRSHLNGVLLDRVVQFGKVLIYLPYFITGVMLFSIGPFLEYFKRFNLADAALTSALLVSYLLIEDREEALIKVIAAFLSSGCAIYIGKAIISLAYRFFNKPSRPISKIVDASFTIYLFHLPIFCAICIPFFWVDLGPVNEFLIITSLTLAVSYLVHMVIQVSPVLSLLFNGKARPSGPDVKSEQRSPVHVDTTRQ
jgi:glucans biosynthesis protein C